MYRIIFVIFIGFSLCPSILTGQISIRATVDSTSMLIGDQQNLKLRIQHPRNGSVKSFYSSALDTIQNLEIISETEWDTSGVDPLALEKNITFSIFDSGYYFIPRIPHAMILNGDTSIHFSNDVPILVNTVTTSDSTALAPIRTIKEEPLSFEDMLPYIGTILGITAIFGLFYWFSKRPQKEEKAAEIPEVIIPAHIIALEKLTELRKKELWQNDQQKEYHSVLTYIVREYLENRYNISALESSTHEIQDDLKKVDFDDRFKDNLAEMLNIADLVKFAKAESTDAINRRIIDEAEEFITTTKQAVEVI
ncbi:MAG: hypothetical protein HKN39_02635 [Flavobacteriales bacterium]|nr:hypothetical protein [Flavobacteriales bacterium]